MHFGKNKNKSSGLFTTNSNSCVQQPSSVGGIFTISGGLFSWQQQGQPQQQQQYQQQHRQPQQYQQQQ